MKGPRISCVNVDVDSLPLYYRIHGLSEESGRPLPSIYETGVVRFLDLFRSHGIRATFFIVAEDLKEDRNRVIANRIVAEGHEIASHSMTHPYDLIRKDRDEIERELSDAEAILTEVRGGQRVTGFRAPGYNISKSLLSLLVERGYLYDSSFFPSPPYYLAKAAYLSMYRLMGKPSQSILGSPSMMFSKRLPHLVTPEKDSGNIVEIPITVLPGIRFPLIGTSLISLGQRGWRLIRPLVDRTPFINLEFHAIDMTDHEADGIDDVLLRQPDQRVPLEAKQELFSQCLSRLCTGWDILSLEESARNFRSRLENGTND